MAVKLYLDEDVDPLLARSLQERGFDCISTRDAKNLGSSDEAQLAFAVGQRRAILTFNIRDFVKLAKTYADSGKRHAGIIVSDHRAFRDLLRRTLALLHQREISELSNQVLWLQDYKEGAP